MQNNSPDLRPIDVGDIDVPALLEKSAAYVRAHPGEKFPGTLPRMAPIAPLAPLPGGALRLTIELVPKPCWYSNVRQVLTREEWDTLRSRVYAEHQQRCAICGARRGPGSWLHCHEQWNYDDSAHVQRLDGFIAICEWCHRVKHIGLSSMLAAQERLDFEQVVQHFLRVNGCDRRTFERHYREAYRLWGERNQHEWRTEIGGDAAQLCETGRGETAG